LNALRGACRRILTPQLVDDLLERDDLVRTQQQQREERALLVTAEVDRTTCVQYLERS
jgi:hypothetical protein